MLTDILAWIILSTIFYTIHLIFGIIAFRNSSELFRKACIHFQKERGGLFLLRIFNMLSNLQKDFMRVAKREERLITAIYILYGLFIMLAFIVLPIAYKFFTGH